MASALAQTMLHELVPKVLARLDLHIHEDHRICGEFHMTPEVAEVLAKLSDKSSAGPIV